MTKELPQIVPASPPEIDEKFAAHYATRQFYWEVEVREEFKRHCEWYYTTAERHRQELEQMRGEFNVFRLFRRRG